MHRSDKGWNWKINPFQEVIQTDAVYDRVSELENLSTPDERGKIHYELDQDEQEELVSLKQLQGELEQNYEYSDLKDGAYVLVRITYMKEYAKQEAYDLGYIDEKQVNSEYWSPVQFIDWDAATKEFFEPSTEILFEDHKYYCR